MVGEGMTVYQGCSVGTETNLSLGRSTTLLATINCLNMHDVSSVNQINIALIGKSESVWCKR